MSRCEFIVPTFSQAVGLPLPSHGRNFQGDCGGLAVGIGGLSSDARSALNSVRVGQPSRQWPGDVVARQLLVLNQSAFER